MKETAIKIAAVGVIIVVAYVGWHIRRHVNYDWFYKAQVQAEIQKQLEPLNRRVADLESQVAYLKAK